MKIKIFKGTDLDSIENIVNTWISDNNITNIISTSISLLPGAFYCLVVTYKEGRNKIYG